MQAFERFYNEHWLPVDEYFDFHKRRHLRSFEILNPLVEPESIVVSLSGGGPLENFFRMDRGVVAAEIKTDLREPFAMASSTCDWVICTEVIEHIKDKNSTKISELESFNYSGVDNLLSETARILRPGGRMFISTPDASSFTTLNRWMLGELPYMDPHHIREFTVDLLNQVCAKHSLELEVLELRNSWGNVSQDVLVQLQDLLVCFPFKRAVSREENIYAIYRKD